MILMPLSLYSVERELKMLSFGTIFVYVSDCVSFLLKVMRENIIVVKRKIPVLVKSHGRTFQATCGRVSQHHM